MHVASADMVEAGTEQPRATSEGTRGMISSNESVRAEEELELDKHYLTESN